MTDSSAKASAFTAFPFVDPGSKPHDAVRDASAALKAVTALIDRGVGLRHFDKDHTHGLGVILSAVARVMDGAAELLTPPKSALQEHFETTMHQVLREIEAAEERGEDFDEAVERSARKLRRRNNGAG